MKEDNKLNLLTLLKKHVFYVDGFWILNDTIVDEFSIREFIHSQWTRILEKDVTDIISELTYNRAYASIDEYFSNKIKERAGTGKSKYFESMDKLYPNNKFRQIMNYYLFSDECYSFILIGYGQTGKTTFVSLIAKIIGECFFGRANVALLKNSHGTATLEGKKLYEVAEAQDLDLDTANMLKSIITNDDIYINPKFQLPRTITPHTKLIMTCNNMPRFKVTDDGIIRRFITIKMDNKIKKQDRNFLKMIEDDIPNIIQEAIDNPFNIEDFAEEQYEFFKNDPQWGFGYGYIAKDYEGENEFEKYKSMCRALGYFNRNKANFDKFLELEKIYRSRCKCAIISKDAVEQLGIVQLTPYEDEDLPF